MHVPERGEGRDENEEEQRRTVASRQMGQPVPGRSQRRVSDWLCFLILPCLQGMQVKAMETSSIHLEKEMEKDAHSFAASTRQQQQQQPHGDGSP